MSERGENFLKSLAGSRASVVGHPVPIADMGRVMFIEDVFLGSETDIAFLNSFAMRAAFMDPVYAALCGCRMWCS